MDLLEQAMTEVFTDSQASSDDVFFSVSIFTLYLFYKKSYLYNKTIVIYILIIMIYIQLKMDG